MAKQPAAPASTVQTVTAYAVIPGKTAESGWTVVKFKTALPPEVELVYANSDRSLASVSASRAIGLDTLSTEPVGE